MLTPPCSFISAPPKPTTFTPCPSCLTWISLYALYHHDPAILASSQAMTSFRWLRRLHERRDSLALRVNGMFGESNRYAMFTLIQFVLTVRGERGG